MASDKKQSKQEKYGKFLSQTGNKQEALDAMFVQLEKQFGKGTVMRMGERGIANIDVISTGSIGLDAALGVGGLPRGRIVEVYGPESSGKTTIALHVLAQAQKNSGEVAFIDAEHALDPEYAKRLGVDIDKLILSQPDNGEQALEITEILARSGAIDVIVVDSVAALVPKTEIEGEMGDSFIGLQARLMSQALRKLTGVVSRTKTIVIFINQLREKVGVMFGSPEVTTGGHALKFYASVRIDIRKGEAIKNGNDVLGSRTRVKVAKNKLAPPFRTTEFDIMFGEGISRAGEVLDYAVDYDIIHKSGSWFSYNDARIGQGRDNAKQFLIDNSEIMDEVELEVRKRLGLIKDAAADAPVDADADASADAAADASADAAANKADGKAEKAAEEKNADNKA